MNKYLLTLLVFVVAAILSAMAPLTKAQKQTDGPVSVDLGDVFERGSIKIEDADLAKLPSLPRGYVPLNNKAHRITTDAVAAGTYTVVFKLPSVADKETFNTLRIFHAEPEPFDPESLMWVDRTASEPDPDFAARTITAKSQELEPGFYLVGRLVEKIAPSTAVADLEIVAKGTPESIQMPNKATFSVSVKNNGPDVATNVGIVENIDSGLLVSATASQGTCKGHQRRVYCKLGQLGVGAEAKITIAIEPNDDFAGDYRSSFSVAGQESDSNTDNNETEGTVLAYADPNEAPEVVLEGPLDEQVLEPGSTVTLKATATDANGSISKVEFWHNIESLGLGSSTDAKHFSLTTKELANGWHVFSAIATDNGGRQTESRPVRFFVNGPTKVRVLGPKAGALIKLGADLVITVEAINPSAAIKSVEILLNGVSCGHGVSVGDNRYALKVRNVPGTTYRVVAFVVDDAGSASRTAGHTFKTAKDPASPYP